MGRTLQTLSLFVLIAVVVLRPLVGESYDSEESALTAALQGIRDPSPIRTLTFDLVIVLAALGSAVSRLIGGARLYRRTGLEFGTAMVALGAMVSCVTAGNKRLAINGAIDWLCCPIAAMALVQLMTRPWHRRILLAAILASAGVQAFQCYSQYFVEFVQTWQHYQNIKGEFWAQQGLALESPEAALFEARAQAREANGFLSHSNVAGSYLVLCGLAGLGATVGAWRRRNGSFVGRGAAGAFIATAAIVGAVFLTGSTGACVSLLVGGVAWVVASRSEGWISRNRRVVFTVGWLGVLLVLAAGVGYGVATDSLPGWSLTFRWQYWRTAYAMFADHWLTGVGRENFGRHYLQYKPIDVSEEVSNPHNLLVQFTTDSGILGLIGVAAVLLGATWVLSEPTRSGNSVSVEQNAADRRHVLPWGVALLAVVTVGRLPLLGSNDSNYLYYNTVTAGLVWVVGYVVFAFALFQNEAVGPRVLTIRPGALAGLFAFVLHDLINFALFVPGAAMTFFAMFAICVAENDEAIGPTAPPVSTRRRWLPAAGYGLVATVIVLFGILPVGRARQLVLEARQAAAPSAPPPNDAQSVVKLFADAARADPLDPTPLVEEARWWLARHGAGGPPENLTAAADVLQAAIQRDPWNVGLRRMLSRVFSAKANVTGNEADYQEAVAAAREAWRLYPRDPATIVLLADRLLELGEASRSESAIREAIDRYEAALALDQARWSGERYHRFREADIQAVKNKLAQARGLLPALP